MTVLIGLLTRILSLLKGGSSISDDIYSTHMSDGDSDKTLIQKISMKVLDKHTGTSLAFIKMITTEVVAEFKKTHHPNHTESGTSN